MPTSVSDNLSEFVSKLMSSLNLSAISYYYKFFSSPPFILYFSNDTNYASPYCREDVFSILLLPFVGAI